MSRLIIAAIIGFLSINAHSEVYQWKDKYGKIHFSDKKPNNNVSADRVKIKKNKERLDYKEVIRQKPIYNYGRKGYRGGERLVVIDVPAINLDKKEQNKTPVGEAYFGAKCIVPTTMYLEDLADSYKFLISEGTGGLDQGIKIEMDRNNYYSKATRSGFAKHLARNHGGYLLESEINELIILSCYYNSKLEHVYRYRNDLKKIRWRNSKASKAYLKIRWNLTDISNGQILFTGETEGSFDHWTNYLDKHINHSISQTVSEAAQVATGNLLSDKRFVALINAQTNRGNNIHSVTDIDSSGQVEKSKGFIGNAIDTAKLASVMLVINNIKNSVTSYYMLNGKLPGRLSDIDMDFSDDLTNSSLVKFYTLDEEGVIAVRLSEQFGNSAMLVFVPNVRDQVGMVQWKCHGNLNKSILSNLNCNSM